MGATYLDRDGQAQAVIMGSYGIGVGRLLACIAEAHHDDNGLIWPVTIAPYPVHLVLLPGDGAETVAESLYDELRSRSIEVLYDDRDERAGVKFNDADLIGVPIRLTVSKRSLEQGGVEFKRRDDDRKKVIPSDEIVERVAHVIDAMQAKIDETVVEVPLEA
jgi:prolyl-tRNA synthetase